MTSWQEIYPHQIWKLQGALRSETLQSLSHWAMNHQSHIRWRSSLKEKPKYCYSSFDYGHMPLPRDLELSVYSEIVSSLNSLFTKIDSKTIQETVPKTSNLFLKVFKDGSHYDLHSEDQNVFGGFAYVLYLTDEDSGDLIFPSFDDQEIFRSEEEKINWQNMWSKLNETGQSVQYLKESLCLKPQKNTFVVFRTGVPHKVSPYVEQGLGRYCLTGFPFASIS